MSDERLLLDDISRGSAAAFTQLYRTWRHRVHRMAWHVSGSSAIAEDVTQEVFLAVMRNPLAFDPDRGTLAAWLYGIAHRQVLRALKRRGDREPVSEPGPGHDRDGGDGRDTYPDPADAVTRDGEVAALNAAIQALPLPFREAIVLVELQELDYQTAARILGCPLGTVRSRLHRARVLLARSLAGADAQERAPRAFPHDGIRWEGAGS